ncbi:hypothetical protein D3C73_1067970 [compost metagenome]
MGQNRAEAALKPIAAKQMATKANTGPPVVDMNMPVAAITSVSATQACWCFHLEAMAAKPYMATMEMIQGIELNRPTWKSPKLPIFLIMLGNQNVAP